MGRGEDAGGGDLVGVLAEVPVRQRQHRVAVVRRTALQQATSFAPKMLFKKRAHTREQRQSIVVPNSQTSTQGAVQCEGLPVGAGHALHEAHAVRVVGRQERRVGG